MLIAAYILYVGPVMAIALRWTSHRDLVWLTVPVVAVAFGVVSFAVGAANTRPAVTLNIVGTLEAIPGSNQAHLDAYTRWWAMRGTSVDVSLPAGSLISPPTEAGANVAPSQASATLAPDGQPDLHHYGLGTLNAGQFRTTPRLTLAATSMARSR